VGSLSNQMILSLFFFFSATDSDEKGPTEVVVSASASEDKELNKTSVHLKASESFPADYGVLEKAFKKAAWYSLALTSAVGIVGMWYE